uniref:Secreted protein n=1 Tax=Ditylenchus dipsaci TaxID=166011 RepID=A0A915E4K4_9BILA
MASYEASAWAVRSEGCRSECSTAFFYFSLQSYRCLVGCYPVLLSDESVPHEANSSKVPMKINNSTGAFFRRHPSVAHLDCSKVMRMTRNTFSKCQAKSFLPG